MSEIGPPEVAASLLACCAATSRFREHRSKDMVKIVTRPKKQTPIDNTLSDFASSLRSLSALRSAARDCKACDLWKTGTQTVFGEGPSTPEIIFVGEQPGDQEDRTGHPFVGPAGKLLNEAMQQAGIDPSRVYFTNVVKHFKWVAAQRGKKRIHKKPRYSEINACRPWLDAELRVAKPKVLVCLGATAAQSLLGREFSVTRQRGQPIESTLAPFVMATVHPSSILRAQDEDARHSQMQAFVKDLKIVAARLKIAKAA
jgi:uracil-DNA glycosylase